MNLRSHIKAWVPPAIMDARRRRLGHGLSFSDVRGGWSQAQASSTGYSAETIVERVTQATREVIAGRACFERDSVLFQEPDYPYPIVTTLLHAALRNAGRLTVIDFGGSLGSTYRQCKPFLREIPQLRWHVIEQPKFVAVGQQEFSTSELSFAYSVSELPASDVRPLILLSSVLQYLEDPERTLDDLLRLQASHLVIDRTPMSVLDAHRLCIQHAPKNIYHASYPCWVISRSRVGQRLSASGWQVLGEFPGMEGSFSTPSGVDFEFRGLIAEKN